MRFLTRRELRECALRVLFQFDRGRVPVAVGLANEIREHAIPPSQEVFLRELVTGTERELKAIDDLISRHLQGWRLDRIAAVDLNVLRLAIFELLYMKDIPPRVTINEAVEIAKKFGDDESGRFVNGVLARIVKEIGRDSSQQPE